ncbi:GIY-YIG nuclease family protein, partial [Ferrovum myxofaciens]|uniref:GIY-YIG nuclease family protein n=1 Tax=Ferrovum myxofaciens TaxID=416213 RepID=UPI0007836E06
MPSATIKIFLVHGDAKRLRTAELSNWTGKAVAGPRSEFDSVLARDESQNSGIYFLTGIDPETGMNAVYIGEAESIRDRVKSHLNKDYWNHISFFTSKDENLTKSHIRYLEGRLIEQAKQAGRAQVKNNQGSGSRLPESDREDMEIFLEKIHQLLPVLGVEVLVPTSIKTADATELVLLSCEIKGLKSKGYLTPNGIVVYAVTERRCIQGGLTPAYS